ncbi:MAG: type II secretion system protein [Campylobacterales bacterium]|nr:type II secretion system protein [Campylobacterales bacterium]
MRKAFTLIEVMVAVMIVSVVIAALLRMQGESAHKFIHLKGMLEGAPYSSLLLYNANRLGFESSNTNLKDLLGDFELEGDLKRRLSGVKLNISYDEIRRIDMSELDENSSSIVFEIGITKAQTQEFSNSLIRVRIP